MFVGRKKELECLIRQHGSGQFEFSVIYGRRRIGKTELIRRYMSGKRAIYYRAVESDVRINLELLSKEVRSHVKPTSAPEPFDRFEQIFDHLRELSRDKRLIFVIDEYPLLAQACPGLSRLIRQYCDQYWQDTKLHLILCGSSMSFMENDLLDAQSPLIDKQTARLKLRPFSFFETEEFLQPMGKEDIAVLHCVTGGVAAYLQFIDKSQNLERNLAALFLSRSGRLYEEPVSYLKQEMREPKIYNSILNAIASGAARNSKIAAKVNLKSGTLNRYLDDLMELGIVVKETPLNNSARRSVYRIGDGSFRFWYRYVFPNRSAIEREAYQTLFFDQIKKDLPNFMGEGFEEIFLDFFDRMNERGELPVHVTERGRWWGRNPALKREEEIDLIGIGEDMTIFSEVKWNNHRIDLKVIRDLMEKSHLIKAENRFYIFFSKNGFTRGALEYVKTKNNILLLSFLTDPV